MDSPKHVSQASLARAMTAEATQFLKQQAAAQADFARGKPAWGKHLLPHFKIVDGKRYQLHATKGWRKV